MHAFWRGQKGSNREERAQFEPELVFGNQSRVCPTSSTAQPEMVRQVDPQGRCRSMHSVSEIPDEDHVAREKACSQLTLLLAMPAASNRPIRVIFQWWRRGSEPCPRSLQALHAYPMVSFKRPNAAPAHCRPPSVHEISPFGVTLPNDYLLSMFPAVAGVHRKHRGQLLRERSAIAFILVRILTRPTNHPDMPPALPTTSRSQYAPEALIIFRRRKVCNRRGNISSPA